MQLVMRSWNLKPNANIAIPAFVCNSVRRAVINEGFTIVPFDLHPNSFWTNYNQQSMLAQNIDGIVLVHLYGYLHPDSQQLEAFAKAQNVPLLHDLAQCYGVDESSLDPMLPRVYSFSQGKPTTGAFGGLIRNLDAEFYQQHITHESRPALRKTTVQQFIKSRIFGYQLTARDSLTLRTLRLARAVMPETKGITSMTDFQKQAAAKAIELQRTHLTGRKVNYQKLVAAAESSGRFKTAIADENGLFFKVVLLANGEVDNLRTQLKQNSIPFFVLADDLDPALRDGRYPNYTELAHRMIEIPCEASIPNKEIDRLASALKSLK